MRDRYRNVVAAVLATTALAATPARAATIGTIPSGASNDFINLFIGPGTEIEGCNAGFANSFSYGGCGFTHGGGNNTFANIGAATLGRNDALSNCSADNRAGGLVNLGFLINGLTGRGNVFDTAINGTTGALGLSLLLFLDDAGGITESDYDDMFVRLLVEGGVFQVPEPTSLVLLGLGLLGIAAVSRKKLR